MRDVRRFRGGLIAAAIAALVAASVTACSGTRSMYAPDGRPSVLITCKGYLNSWSSCLVKAGRECASRGYDTLHSDDYDRTLIIACKGPASQ